MSQESDSGYEDGLMRAPSPAPPTQMKMTSKMSSITTWNLAMSRMPKTLSNGGLKIGASIPISGKWPGITSQSLVHNKYSKFCSKIGAYNFLTVSSVAVEHISTKGCLLLSHVQNQLSAQSTHALLCLGYWGKLGYIKNLNLLGVASLPDAKDGEMGLDDKH